MFPPTYQTQRFILKPYEPKDEERFIEIALDKESIHFMGGANGIEAEARELFQKILKTYPLQDQDRRWFWIWGVYEDDRLCAHLEMKDTENTQPHELEIVYMVHPDARRKGLMTEVLLFLKSQQIEWNRRIIATVSPNNLNSLSLLEKWGIESKETLTDSETQKVYYKLILSR